MKKTTLLTSLLFTACIFMAASSSAQMRFGAIAGLNIANIASDEEVGDQSALIGFHLGGVLDTRFGDGGFGLQPGIMYSGKGSKYSGGGEDYKLAISYIEIPINFVYNFGETGDNHFFVKAGPYLGFAFGGKNELNPDDDKLEIGSSDEDMIKPLDFGINAGAGYELASGLFFSLHYGLGLADISSSDDDTSINTLFGVTVGKFFGGN